MGWRTNHLLCPTYASDWSVSSWMITSKSCLLYLLVFLVFFLLTGGCGECKSGAKREVELNIMNQYCTWFMQYYVLNLDLVYPPLFNSRVYLYTLISMNFIENIALSQLHNSFQIQYHFFLNNSTHFISTYCLINYLKYR